MTPSRLRWRINEIYCFTRDGHLSDHYVGIEMRILIIGGVCRSLTNFRGPMLRDMVAAGHEVFASAGMPQRDVVDELERMQIPYYECELDRRGTNVISDYRCYRSLRLVISKCEPDIVMSYTVKPVIYGTLAAAHRKVPTIVAMITGAGMAQPGRTLRERVLAGVTRSLYARALKHVHVVFFQNPDDEALFRQCRLLGSSRVVQVPGSGVDLEHFAVAPPVIEPVTYLLIARLLANKGIREYAAAAARLRERYGRAVRCVLVGGFDQGGGAVSRAELESWTASGSVEYLGRLEDVRPAIRVSSVYVLPSYREGTPRTVLEAMAMGRPIVTTDVPGCRETVVDGTNGYLATARDVPSLVQAMGRFAQKPELIESMGRESLDFARRRFDVRIVNRTILSELGLH